MSASNSNIQPHEPQDQRRKGLAITSLVLGIVSIPTLGLLGVGAITAMALGAVALNRIKKEPAVYGGKRMAIAGIATSVVSLLLLAFFVISSALMLPKLYESLRLERESAAINSLRTIHNNELQFESMNSRFATLEQLAAAGLLDQNYANENAVSGYVYSTSEVSEKAYCVHAVRTDAAVAFHDFVICEDGIIRLAESKTPAVVKRGEGSALDSSFYSR